MHVLAIIWALSGFMISCSEDLDRRAPIYQTDDAEVDKETTEVIFFLPSREPLALEVADIEDYMNSYYFSFAPEGDYCPKTELIEDAGTYKDLQRISYLLPVECDYLLTVVLGKASLNNSLTMQSSISYESTIGPLMETYCNSCHEDYSSYEGTLGQQENIIVQVENGDMPPEQALNDSEIASFLGWQAGGFTNADPNKVEPNSLLAKFDKRYFRNDLN